MERNYTRLERVCKAQKNKIKKILGLVVHLLTPKTDMKNKGIDIVVVVMKCKKQMQ